MGVQYELQEYSPKMFNLLLKESATRKLEREVAVSIGAEKFSNRRACMDLSRSFLAAKKRSPKESAVVSAACCNALWTRDRLVRSGYELETNLCELCGLQVDTIHHRLYICTDPGAVEARNRVAEKMSKDENGTWWPKNKIIISEAIASGELDPMYLHAVFPHPSDVQPGPALNTGARFQATDKAV